ncbi:MAG: class II aldolase/adducin family protein [Chloroflexi bacterium]|nr:class II aldolase/adducin family protein [Chloroflexota bacterium]
MDLEGYKAKTALCCRLLQMESLIEASGHISVRVPGTDQVLIHPMQASRATIGPKDMLVVDLEGKLLEGEVAPPSETHIHVSIYRRRPDVLSVCHSHSHYATVFSMVQRPIIPACNALSPFHEGIPVFPYSGHIDDREKGEGLAQLLGKKRALFIKGHGAVIAGSCLEEVFRGTAWLEKGAQLLWEASQIGEPAPLPREEIDVFLARTWNPRGWRKEWDYYVSLAQQRGITVD